MSLLFCLPAVANDPQDATTNPPKTIKTSDKIERPRVGTHLGIYPTAQFTSDEGFRVGGFSRVFNYGEDGVLPFENLVTIGAAYAENGASYAWVNYQQTNVTNWNLRTDSEVYYTTSNNERYYGVGENTDFDEELEADGFNFYSFDQLVIYHTFRKEIFHHLDALVGLEFNLLKSKANDSSSTTLFENDFGTSTEEFTGAFLVLGLIRDHRNSEFIPTDGTYAQISGDFSPSTLSNTKTWARGSIDLRYYTSILDERRLWFAAQARYSASSDDTPLSKKAYLGSSSTLRGLRQNRFVSNHSVSLRAGLRSIWGRARFFDLPLKVGSGFFVDTGNIGDEFSGVFSGKTHVAYGITLFGSYFTDDFLGHADIGVSDETTSLYLGLGHVF